MRDRPKSCGLTPLMVAVALLVSSDACLAHRLSCPIEVAPPLLSMICSGAEDCCAGPHAGPSRDACDCCSHLPPSHQDERDPRPTPSPTPTSKAPNDTLLGGFVAWGPPHTGSPCSVVALKAPAPHVPIFLQSSHLRF